MNLSQILIRPVLTEKSVRQEAISKFTFEVHDSATKVDVKNALHSLYGVGVARVNILHTLPKYRLGKGKHPLEKRQGMRRAIVTLKPGEKLDFGKAKPTKAKTSKSAPVSK